MKDSLFWWPINSKFNLARVKKVQLFKNSCKELFVVWKFKKLCYLRMQLFDSFLQAGARCNRSFNIAVNYFGAKNRSAGVAPEVNLRNL